MNGDHRHVSHGAGARHRRPLAIAFALVVTFMVVEIVAGFATDSLALLSDAGHMATDALGLGMALAAITAADRADLEGHRTYGLYRLEILAALANAALLFGVAGYVLFEAADRFADPPEVLSGPMLVVAVLGIFLKSILLLVAERQVGYTKARVTTDLRLRLLRAVMSSRWSYFVHQPVGRLTNSMATEAWRASIAYEFGVGIVAYGIQAVIYGSVAMMVSWRATLASLAAGFVILFVSHFLVKMTRKAGKRQTVLLRSLLSRMTDTLHSVKTLKAMGREGLADNVLRTETGRLNKALEAIVEDGTYAEINAKYFPFSIR